MQNLFVQYIERMECNEEFKMTIKMVATDIDGTILKHTGEFNPKVIDCIKNLVKNGIKVILITGRMYKSAKKIADSIGITTPIVAYQGALVKDNSLTENVFYERYIPNEISKRIIDWAKLQNVHINLYMNDELYVEAENEFTKKYVTFQKIPFNIASFDEIELNSVNKILLIDYENPDKITKINNQLKQDFPELFIVKSTDFFCEVCQKEATKGHGLKYLQELYGIKKEETLTIGDHNNDIELLLAGGIKVAMGNATKELKSVADYVTDDVDNDGFVKAIEKFIKVGVNV